MKLTLRNIVKIFKSYDKSDSTFRAIDDVSLEVGDGELVTLLGPSGCGKTTLLRMLAGFEDPTEGDILFGEDRMNDLPPNQRGTAMVFQSYAIFPHLSVRENILFGLRLQNLSETEIAGRLERVLDMVQLHGLENRRPEQLSGGQQQRVALARAVIMEPAILLFDEPLSNLDAKLREQMRVDIRKIQQRLGITSVYVTHDQVEAMSISDRVVVMNRGRIEQLGTPRQLYATPINTFVANFIGKANLLPVRCDEGRWTLLGQPWAPPSPLVFAGEGKLLVRPEGVRPVAMPEVVPAGAVTGVLTRVTYLGSLVEYEVLLPGNITLTAHIPAPTEVLPPVADTPVVLEFIPGAVHILRD